MKYSHYALLKHERYTRRKKLNVDLPVITLPIDNTDRTTIHQLAEGSIAVSCVERNTRRVVCTGLNTRHTRGCIYGTKYKSHEGLYVRD